jgi:hypothetical protein
MSATAWLLRQGIWTFSPIVHCHELAKRHSFPRDFLFWQNYNFAMLGASRGLFVLKLPGWQQSKGVAGEIAKAKELNLIIQPILVLESAKVKTIFSLEVEDEAQS